MRRVFGPVRLERVARRVLDPVRLLWLGTGPVSLPVPQFAARLLRAASAATYTVQQPDCSIFASDLIAAPRHNKSVAPV
jgi:hypothetical protein